MANTMCKQVFKNNMIYKQGELMMNELIIQSTLNNLEKLQEFVEAKLVAANCPMATVMKVSMAVEEIYINIVNYAYNPEIGEAKVICEIKNITSDTMQVSIQFQDSGAPFNPLSVEDADITLSSSERQIGGLGIHLVKKIMDDVKYKYEEGKNILIINKKF